MKRKLTPRQRYEAKMIAEGKCSKGDGKPLVSTIYCMDHLKKNGERQRKRRRDAYLQAVKKIANQYGDQTPRCRHDLTPELSKIQCLGNLQIDHINGGGGKEFRKAGSAYYEQISTGRRDVKGLRILCELHNQAWKILRSKYPQINYPCPDELVPDG